ncbi:hypothetical protein DPMN_117704 [Dreissena polymorpha]|uniref:Reverse transcriptase domain-containing protein n=1 Tax=Dreissena polymorpha TaxID=45954 RepID=A0A9D4GIU9_DREPO|nr:hypothetical protein DPMN_117704 [Dreissena polymorpha]
MLERVASTTGFFADKSLLYRNIRTTEDTCTGILQEDLKKLEQWERDWQMQFNPSKCETINFTKNGIQSRDHTSFTATNSPMSHVGSTEGSHCMKNCSRSIMLMRSPKRKTTPLPS